MKVTWVHPSWRDLVIEHLSEHDVARERFLRRCSIHGCLLALSSGGGASGQRRAPLLNTDPDWDALSDRLYVLVPDLEQAELIGLLDALGLALKHGSKLDTAEAYAVSRSLLDRIAAVWRASGRPIELRTLEAWLALGAKLRPRPVPPALSVTWADVLPAGPPDIADGAALERFVEWLTLVELVSAYNPATLGELGFPGRSLEYCESFVSALEERPHVDPADATQLEHALRRIRALMPALSDRIDHRLLHFSRRAVAARPTRTPPTDWPRPRDWSNDVVRVLRDL